jgi:hypothetical protein
VNIDSWQFVICYIFLEKQINLESNAVSRILNKEIRAQLPANISDALLWKRIEKAKKLYKLFSVIGMDKIYQIHSFSADSISKMTNKDIQYIIDNVPFDYSIKIESTLKSEFPELSSGSDRQISCEKEVSQNEDAIASESLLETKVSTSFASQPEKILLETAVSVLANNNNDISPETKLPSMPQLSAPDDEDSSDVDNVDNENDDEFSDNDEEEDDDGFCGFSDDEGYYYDLNTGKACRRQSHSGYTKSEHRYSIRAY